MEYNITLNELGMLHVYIIGKSLGSSSFHYH